MISMALFVVKEVAPLVAVVVLVSRSITSPSASIPSRRPRNLDIHVEHAGGFLRENAHGDGTAVGARETAPHTGPLLLQLPGGLVTSRNIPGRLSAAARTMVRQALRR